MWTRASLELTCAARNCKFYWVVDLVDYDWPWVWFSSWPRRNTNSDWLLALFPLRHIRIIITWFAAAKLGVDLCCRDVEHGRADLSTCVIVMSSSFIHIRLIKVWHIANHTVITKWSRLVLSSLSSLWEPTFVHLRRDNRWLLTWVTRLYVFNICRVIIAGIATYIQFDVRLSTCLYTLFTDVCIAVNAILFH